MLLSKEFPWKKSKNGKRIPKSFCKIFHLFRKVISQAHLWKCFGKFIPKGGLYMFWKYVSNCTSFISKILFQKFYSKKFHLKILFQKFWKFYSENTELIIQRSYIGKMVIFKSWWGAGSNFWISFTKILGFQPCKRRLNKSSLLTNSLLKLNLDKVVEEKMKFWWLKIRHFRPFSIFIERKILLQTQLFYMT